MAANKTIILKGNGIREEALAAVAIKPGYLLEYNSDGKLIPHNSAGQSAYPLFAVEDDLQGNDVDDTYAIGALVQADFCHTGMMVHAWLVNGGTACVIGNLLESAGDGQLQLHVADISTSTIYDRQIVAVCREAVDMSGSSAVDPTGRMKVSIV